MVNAGLVQLAEEDRAAMQSSPMGVGLLMSDCEEAINPQLSYSAHDKVPQGQDMIMDTHAALASHPSQLEQFSPHVFTSCAPASTMSVPKTLAPHSISVPPVGRALALAPIQAAIAAAAAAAGEPVSRAADVTDMLDQRRAFPTTAGASDALTAIPAGPQCLALLQPHLSGSQAELESPDGERSSGRTSPTSPTLSLCTAASSGGSSSLVDDYWSLASSAASINEEEQTELEQAGPEPAEIQPAELERGELALDQIEQAQLEQALKLSLLEVGRIPEGGAAGFSEGEQDSTVLASEDRQAQELEAEPWVPDSILMEEMQFMTEEEILQAVLRLSLEEVPQQTALVGPLQPLASLVQSSDPVSILRSTLPLLLGVFPRFRRVRGVHSTLTAPHSAPSHPCQQSFEPMSTVLFATSCSSVSISSCNLACL